MVDGVGTNLYGYDAAGQLLSEDGPWAFDTVSYSYLNRRRTGLTLLSPNSSAWVESYGYDNASRLTSVSSPAGAFNYTLGGAGASSPLVSKLLLPTGAFITNTYDSVARQLSTKLFNPALSTLNAHVYSYNQGNQRTQQVFTAGNYVNYTYDNMGELLSARGKESGGSTTRLQEQFGYAYDAAGNLNYRTNNDALTESFNVNSLNELTNITRGGTLTVAGTTTSPATNVTVNGSAASRYSDSTFALGGFTIANGSNTFTVVARDGYGRQDTSAVTVNLPSTNTYSSDANGNLLSDGTRSFAYDDENQMVSVWVTNVWRSDFAYDGKMRRRIRREYTWQSSAWVQTNEVRYLYDGNLVIQERDANNLPQVGYTRGIDLSGGMQGAGGIGGLLARTDLGLWALGSGLSHAYYHADGNGNVTMLINTSNAVVAKYEYDPYGNILSRSGSLADANLYRFSSKEYHPNSGLVYYLYRFYDPNLQRWPNRDPKDDPSFINSVDQNGEEASLLQPTLATIGTPYNFNANDPNVLVDPLGLDSLSISVSTIIRPPDIEPGLKTRHSLIVDDQGNVSVKTAFIGSTSGMKGTGWLNAWATKENSCEVTLDMAGYANSFWLPKVLAIRYLFEFDILFCEKKGCLSGFHETYPSYTVKVKGSSVYDYQQHDKAGLVGSPLVQPDVTFKW
jgi:RHS repeat-associated protein